MTSSLLHENLLRKAHDEIDDKVSMLSSYRPSLPIEIYSFVTDNDLIYSLFSVRLTVAVKLQLNCSCAISPFEIDFLVLERDSSSVPQATPTVACNRSGSSSEQPIDNRFIVNCLGVYIPISFNFGFPLSQLYSLLVILQDLLLSASFTRVSQRVCVQRLLLSLSNLFLYCNRSNTRLQYLK